MARRWNQIPTYKLHSSTGLARCWVGGKWVTLGKYGTPESRAEFARIIAELNAAPSPASAVIGGAAPTLTVDQVLLAFWKHAEQHYRRPDGTPTQEISEYRQAFKVLRPLYGHTPASGFGPLALKAVRGGMVAKGWARTLVNRRVGRIRRAFKWAASEQLVPVAVHQSLGTVAGLQQGRSKAPEMVPVEPVAWEHVARTLPFLRPHVAAMVQVQWLTGMRPGEVCDLRPADIDRTGPVWIYKPGYYKLSYQGGKRVIVLGPRAQAILTAFAPPSPDGHYFSPRESVEQFHAERGRNRKTPKYKSHMARNVAKRTVGGSRRPAAKYNADGYGHSVAAGIEAANRPLVEAAVEVELHVPKWSPNQLRHAHATAVRQRFDLESAQAVMGHKRMNTTEVYAEKNLEKAKRVASEMG